MTEARAILEATLDALEAASDPRHRLAQVLYPMLDPASRTGDVTGLWAAADYCDGQPSGEAGPLGRHLAYALRWAAGRGLSPRKLKKHWRWYVLPYTAGERHTLPYFVYLCMWPLPGGPPAFQTFRTCWEAWVDLAAALLVLRTQSGLLGGPGNG